MAHFEQGRGRTAVTFTAPIRGFTAGRGVRLPPAAILHRTDIPTPSERTMIYSKNPIINRFLQITIEEGKSVRCLALGHYPDSAKTLTFCLGDGTDVHYVAEQDGRAFMTSWKDASDFVKRLRHVDLSPAL